MSARPTKKPGWLFRMLQKFQRPIIVSIRATINIEAPGASVAVATSGSDVTTDKNTQEGPS